MIDLAALAPLQVAGRIDRLRAGFAEARVDALLVTSLTNIRYLTGFTGSAALVLVRADEVVFVTDGRYGDQAGEQLAAAGVTARIEVSGSDQRRLLADALDGVAHLGLEADHVSWARQRDFAESWFPAAELVATSGLVEALRVVKDEGEVARIEAAATIADAALAEVRPLLAEGVTELAFARELDQAMRRRGAEDVSFETIVASGPNGARPHARPSGRPIAAGDLVVLDFGALLAGYHSDMTRTVAVGEASPTQARMLEVVLAAQQAGVDAVRAGAAAADVDRACRDVVVEAGWGEAFLHGTGHGVGLDIHEAPRVAATSDATLADRSVVTVEPGVYLAEHGGVRIEDTVLVTTDGCRPLTRTPKTTAV
ncbi:MAG: Xaa-Pro peptidase family protein [Acidimicrobiales bacterium]|jgi:Xaa-Pro aminopeptidase|nr:Xaa-Pro peptidase family protein [Acidimicrobiales bacterium]